MDKPQSVLQEADSPPESPLGRKLDAWLPEMVKRALLIGAGTLFLTEEGIRKALSDFNLPKDVVSYLIKQSEKSKTELFSIFQRELNRFLSRIDITRITKEVLDGISLEIHSKITFHGKRDDARPAAADESETTRRARSKTRK